MTTKKTPSIDEVRFNTSSIIYNNIGIDTIQLIANYKTAIKLVERMGLSVVNPSKNSPVSERIIKIENSKDKSNRYKTDDFKTCTQIVKLSNGKSLSNYMIITQNIPLLFDHAEHHKKAKDTFCLITFAGLHQPTKQIESEAMKIISKFLKRKTFKRYSVDIATDGQEDKQPIKYSRKEPFKDDLMPYSQRGVIIPPNRATSLYINNIKHRSISRILYYDKYLKMTKHHKQRGINANLRNWKRLEITLTFDVTKRENKGFTQYMESMDFFNVLHDIDEVSKKAKINSYDTDYLTYQINSFKDNRFMNNYESKEQFNGVESLERFKQSDFRRYLLAI